MKPLAIAAVLVVLFVVGIGGGYFYLTQRSAQDTPSPAATEATLVESESTEHGKSVIIPEDATICATHRIPEVICPFCKSSLVDELGHCGVHDVAEALCSRCNPTLIAAFKAEGDWCTGHGLPESQCALCGGGEIASAGGSESSEPGGQICSEHNVPEAMCPFCDPSLIEKLGHCRGHDVPEALCTRCNPAIIPAFKAEGDWCQGHGLPESQCLECNPPSGS